jgi:hypothetical protein
MLHPNVPPNKQGSKISFTLNRQPLNKEEIHEMMVKLTTKYGPGLITLPPMQYSKGVRITAKDKKFYISANSLNFLRERYLDLEN